MTNVVRVTKTTIRTSCSIGRVCRAEKKTIDASTIEPVPNVVPESRGVDPLVKAPEPDKPRRTDQHDRSAEGQCSSELFATTVTGTATSVPAFAHMDVAACTILVKTVARELDPVLRSYIQREELVFLMRQLCTLISNYHM